MNSFIAAPRFNRFGATCDQMLQKRPSDHRIGLVLRQAQSYGEEFCADWTKPMLNLNRKSRIGLLLHFDYQLRERLYSHSHRLIQEYCLNAVPNSHKKHYQ